MARHISGRIRSYPRRGRRPCMEALARLIADDAARSDIEAMCERSGDHYVTIVRTDGNEVDEPATAEVARAVTYLELRGRLAHHPVRPDLVRFV